MTNVAPQETGVIKRPLADADVVSERLGIPLSSVYEKGRRGELPGCIRLGRRMKFDLDKLESWIERGGETGDAR